MGVMQAPPNKGLKCATSTSSAIAGRRRQGGIDPVQNAAMAWNDGAGILDAEMALDEGFKQVAAMGGEAEHETRTAPPPGEHIRPAKR